MDGDKGDQGADEARGGSAGDGEGAEVDGEVVVGAGEGLDDGEAEEEVARGDPALGDDVFAQEGDDDGPAAEDYGSGEVEVCEEGEVSWWGVQDCAQGEGGDEG